MTRNEIETILSNIIDKEIVHFDSPSTDDWNKLSKKFNCNFSKEFKFFIDLMSDYSFPGDIFNVSSGKNNGNDFIDLVYDMEMNSGVWNSNMMPFYGIGNGDYFCISSMKSDNSSVFYYYHEENKFKKYSNSFEEWIKELPNFLA